MVIAIWLHKDKAAELDRARALAVGQRRSEARRDVLRGMSTAGCMISMQQLRYMGISLVKTQDRMAVRL